MLNVCSPLDKTFIYMLLLLRLYKRCLDKAKEKKREKMKTTTENTILGDIVYDENIWTGKKVITVNGEQLAKIDKKTFRLPDARYVTVKGNLFFDASLIVDGQKITIAPPMKWYEYILALIIPIFVLTWGNSVYLCSIFPIVGGAIGGAISALAMIFSAVVMRKVSKPIFKILIGLGFFVATLMVCNLLAIAILAALT